jgi:hypothetical protein
MWRVIVVLAACGGGGGGAAVVEPTGPAEPRAVVVEWKVEQGDGNTVEVSLVVDGNAVAIGALDAATEYEAGTPSTCALRAASARRTEIVCGDANAFIADLVEGELLVTLAAGEQRSEVKRIRVDGEALSVKMLSLPLDGG